MMSKLKVMTILGTRPEIIRLSACIKACDAYFDHVLVHTGQNWDPALNQALFSDLELRAPDIRLDCAGGSLGDTMGNIIARAYETMRAVRPDALVLLGDTNSTLAAIPAKRLKIPIFHLEAGNRCWDWNVPEMINRKIVDHIADINLPYTEHARRYLLSEGLDGKTIFVLGSPMPEVLSNHMEKIRSSDIRTRLGLDRGGYILVSAHREENIDDEAHFTDLMQALNAAAGKYGMPVVCSIHPRTRRFIEARQFQFHPLVRLHEPFGFLDYNKLQLDSYCVLSDSGTLSEESALLGFAGVLIRTSTERPEVLDKGAVVIGGITATDILQAVETAVMAQADRDVTVLPDDYRDTNVSIKLVKIIQSYTKIVNRTTWLK